MDKKLPGLGDHCNLVNDLRSQQQSVGGVNLQADVQQTLREINFLIGSNIRYQRVLAGYSLVKLGEAIGVTSQQIQKNECGLNNISAALLKLAADALNVSVAHFYGVPVLAEGQGALPRDTAEIVQMACALNNKQREAVKNLLQAFIRSEGVRHD